MTYRKNQSTLWIEIFRHILRNILNDFTLLWLIEQLPCSLMDKVCVSSAKDYRFKLHHGLHTIYAFLCLWDKKEIINSMTKPSPTPRGLTFYLCVNQISKTNFWKKIFQNNHYFEFYWVKTFLWWQGHCNYWLKNLSNLPEICCSFPPSWI